MASDVPESALACSSAKGCQRAAWCLRLLLQGTVPSDVCMLDMLTTPCLCCQRWRLQDLLGTCR